jgi:SPP1 gp7 family putative phage head morphogenesis protein
VPRTPDILRVIENHQAALDRGGRATSSRLVDEYSKSWKRINADLEKLVQKIAEAQARGEVVNPSWLFREDRYRQLLRQVEREINDFSRFAYKRIQTAQADVIGVAQRHATSILRTGAAQAGVQTSFATLPTGAVENILATTGPRSPLQTIFASMGKQTAESVGSALVSGVVAGRSPRLVAREVQRVSGMPLSRALTIARTETLRAYREASRQTYQQNGDVVEGWIWHAALDARGCLVCWAKHGSRHPLSEPFSGHPNCRCAMVPEISGWSPSITPGATEFAQLSAAEQEAILGPSKFRAYKDGAVTLDNLVKETHSPVWGTTVSERSLRDAVGANNAAQYYRR